MLGSPPAGVPGIDHVDAINGKDAASCAVLSSEDPQEPGANPASQLTNGGPDALSVHSGSLQADGTSAEAWRLNLRKEDADFTSRPDGSRPDWFWTGRRPEAGAPGVRADGTITSLPLPNVNASKQAVLDYFENTWLITEVIFSGLQGTEAYYRPPYHNLRHPMIFYYAHPAALYVNKLRVAGLLSEPVNAQFEHIFETGVDEMAWDDLSKNDMMWPMVKEVTEYRRTVFQLVRDAILQSTRIGGAEGEITWDCPEWAIFMGFEHERIHIETSTVLIRELPLSLVKKPVWWPALHPHLHKAAPENDLVVVPAGDVVLGKPKDWPSFGWDNEYGRRSFHVPEFSVSKFMITNSEFLEFVKDGGYRDESLWSPDGWRWRTFRNAKWAAFWVPSGPAGLHQYSLRLIWEVVPMPPAAPAVVNKHEADAYAAWRSRRADRTISFRLITEVEHNRMRKPSCLPGGPGAAEGGGAGRVPSAAATLSDVPVHELRGDGRAAADAAMTYSGEGLKGEQNVQLAFGAEGPVDAFGGFGLGGVGQVMGNVWHWCEDWFAALPGGHGVHPLYDDFSSPCYDGQHSIIMGGSFMSTGAEASRFARFHFRPHFHQHAGFRIAAAKTPATLSHVDSPPPHVGSWNPSSSRADSMSSEQRVTEKLISQYGMDHLSDLFGAILQPEALQYCAKVASFIEGVAHSQSTSVSRVMEIGCTTGGLAFKLAAFADAVLAVDLDSDMVKAARQLQADGSLTVRAKQEGILTQEVAVVRAEDEGVAGRVTFRQMDPCGIQPDVGMFDIVVLHDFLDRCISPKAPLGRMGGTSPLVKPGGLVISISAYDWDPAASDEKLWLGGTLEKQSSKDSLAATLGDGFKLVAETNFPLVVHRHARKMCLSVMNVLAWRYF